MINKIIRNYIAKRMAGRSDDGIMITLKDPQRVTLGENIMADLLMRNGINPVEITSEAQLKAILQQIENAEAAAIRNTGIRSTESAKVFNTAGEELDPSKPIIGGTQPGKSIDQDTFIRLAETNTQRMKQKIADKKIDDDLPPPGSRGGPDDIAAPVQSAEETIKNMIEAKNKKGIENLKQKMAKEKARTQRISGNLRADNLQRVEIGKPKLDKDEYDYYRELLDDEENFVVKGDETKEFLEAMVKEQEDEVAYMRRLYDKGALDDPEDFATGGRVGLASGTVPGGYTDDAYKYLREIEMDIKKSYKKYKAGGGTLDFDTYSNLAKGTMSDKDIPSFKAEGGIMRIGLKEGLTPGQQGPMGPVYTTNKIEDAAKEVVKRLVRIDDAKIPLDDKLSIALRGLDNVTIEGVMEILGGQLSFSAGKEGSDKGIGFNFYKQFADGGRIGLKEGSGMTRRTFLKFLAGAASIPIIGKIFKPLKVGKTVTKVPIIKTADVSGKPEWFDQLVNKVILEGDDMTKQFATKERQIVHATKIGKDDYVRVTQDLDEGSVRVEYDSPANTFEDTVQLQYKKPLPDEGSPNPAAEFEVSESGPISRQVGPDDYDMDVDEVGGTSIKDLDSDVSKLKAYATGEKPTMKELVQNIKRKERAKNITFDQEAQMDAVIRRQGEYDGPYDDDFASGGIARMLGE
jgi:hypothetical protein